MSWKSKSGIVYQMAPPYSLMVPPASPEALKLRLPEYYWAQGLLLALHALLLAYENDATCPSMQLAEAAEKLDSVRRAHKLDMSPGFVVLSC